MKRRNGEVGRIRFVKPVRLSVQPIEGMVCMFCGRPTPRGSDRPFCLDHATYVQELIKRLI